MDLTRLISSSCRRKILETLSTLKETYLMDLVRRVNSTYSQVDKHLQILEKDGIIKTRRYGRSRIIRLNNENPNTVLLLKALKMLGEEELRRRISVEKQKEMT